jgi:hypothetical protein
MSKALNALMCKYGPYLIIGTLLVLVAFLQVQEYNSNIDALDQKVDHHLPRPKVSFKSGNNPSSYLTNAMSSKSAESMVFIVRTYKKYTDTKTAQRLIDGLEDQRCHGGDDKTHEGGSDCNLSVSVVMLPTDDDSRQIVEDETTSMQKSGKYRKLDVHLHKVENQVYADNCCQMEAMCHDKLYATAWNEHAYRKYRKYKDIPKKLATVCGGNNLLHYVVTDLALRYTIDSCVSDCDTKYVVMTNGDNTYDQDFVWKVMQKMKNDPSLDLVMTDYLERGVQYVFCSTMFFLLFLVCDRSLSLSLSLDLLLPACIL